MCAICFQGGIKVKIKKESAFKKIILLLVCTAVIVTYIGSAAASDSDDQSSSPLATGTQTQSGVVSFDGNKVSYNLNQDQSAEIISGDGKINQAQQSGVNVDIKGEKGKVTIVTAKASEVQSVDTSSYGSTDSKATPASNAVKTFSVSKDDSGSISLTQGSTEESGDIYQQQTGVIKIIDAPNRNIAIVHLKQK